MALIFWWMLLLWAIAAAIYWVLRYRLLRARRQPSSTILPVAHTHRLIALPEYVATLKRYELLIRAVAGLLTLGLLTTILLSTRPAHVSLVTPTQQNRDIMLCLDASGSVLREDTTLFDRFNTLVTAFQGQRFGLTLFNSSAVTVIPLNDNYQLISQQLKVAAQAFKAQKGATFTTLTNGTLADFYSGTSLVSDGLASCIEHMSPNAHRSESIILATDNEVQGTSVVTMTQDVALAKKDSIHIYVIDPGVSDTQLADDHGQLKTITKETNGSYYQLSNPNAVSSIMDQISNQTSSDYFGVPQVATNDNPVPFIYVAAFVTAASLILLWRLEL